MLLGTIAPGFEPSRGGGKLGGSATVPNEGEYGQLLAGGAPQHEIGHELGTEHSSAVVPPPPLTETVIDLGIVLPGTDPAADTIPNTELVLEPVPTAPEGGLLAASRWQLAAKRGMDIFLSLMTLILVLPILLLTAAIVRVTTSGPALFAQERIGRGGLPFKMLKFRSMHRDAHHVRHDLVDRNEATGPVFKIRDDPRVTPVGRLIRKLSIDELPQLINVLKGEMTLVGPRPPLPEEYASYGARERQRVAVTPGITCIWQVSGRSHLDFETWVDMDLDYIRSWTLRLDLKLLARTLPAVMSARGAY
jgi:lipopolysaccharide/colanic/teichoic acid biosynthesis glycosyltransferase